jgi:DNA-binding transcriptional ArsR family regulator
LVHRVDGERVGDQKRLEDVALDGVGRERRPALQLAFTKPQGLADDISMCLSVGMDSEIFRALADPTRRSVFEKLAVGGMNASDLRRGMTISQPAMSQHLAVLRSAGLVRERRDGRFVNYEVDPDGLVRIGQWLARYRAYWPRRIDSLKALLKDMDQ